NVVLSEQTPYQKIVMTADRGDIRLYLDGNLQFSSLDEYRYHESLIHVPMGLASFRGEVLLLGAGDGIAAREILKYKDVRDVTIVDLDKRVTDLASKNPLLRDINQESLDDSRVKIVHDDAFRFLNGPGNSYDMIFADLPDPNNLSLAKLYSREFYRLILKRLKPGGIFSGQSTSPYYSKNAFWCIKQSLEAAGLLYTYPYHVNIPSFGEWGFVMGSMLPIDLGKFKLSVETKFLTDDISHLFYFEKDIQEVSLMVSSLDRPTVLTYYLDGWEKHK
ncbi:MAG: spermidine synthase, partial [Nitrospinota bacterium]